MYIHGFLKTTLLDYPGKVASTIFCGSCNFRCPYCHNGDLVLHPNTLSAISEDEILNHLKKRIKILDGVCITGGEPTLQSDLASFISRIKELGFLVKLDTNGYHPEILKDLVSQDLIDFIAMDVKSSLANYPKVCQIPDFQPERIQESVEFLLQGDLPYEFRTTVTKTLHSPDDLCDIAQWIKDAPAYYLQPYKDSDQVLTPGQTGYSRDELMQILTRVQQILPVAALRGID